MTHRDGFPRRSARSAWRGDAGHRKPCAPSKCYGPSAPWPKALGEAAVPVAQANRHRANGLRASESLADVPQDLRLPSYPADRLRDLYESLSSLLGISLVRGPRASQTREPESPAAAREARAERFDGGRRYAIVGP